MPAPLQWLDNQRLYVGPTINQPSTIYDLVENTQRVQPDGFFRWSPNGQYGLSLQNIEGQGELIIVSARDGEIMKRLALPPYDPDTLTSSWGNSGIAIYGGLPLTVWPTSIGELPSEAP